VRRRRRQVLALGEARLFCAQPGQALGALGAALLELGAAPGGLRGGGLEARRTAVATGLGPLAV
jgi:hypothetical protein